jgi:geranylgeranyl diphosphate synthase type II
MIELKTSVLIAAAFQMGALIGGATPSVAEQLYAFGLNIGIAFQIQDDILDTYGDPEKFGKKVGGDIVQNKKTYLVLKTLELANTTQRTDLQRLMRDNNLNENEKIATVKNIFDAVGVQQKAEQLMNDFQSKAFVSLEVTPLSFKKKNYLKSWANALLQRQF